MGAPFASQGISRILYRSEDRRTGHRRPATTIYLGPALLTGLVRSTWD
jgi:hypothetical protein